MSSTIRIISTASLLLRLCVVGASATSFTITDLGTVRPRGLNNHGQVVGGTADGRPFFYDGTNVVVLSFNAIEYSPLQVPPSTTPVSFGSGSAINDQGVVVGWAGSPVTRTSPFVFTGSTNYVDSITGLGSLAVALNGDYLLAAGAALDPGSNQGQNFTQNSHTLEVVDIPIVPVAINRSATIVGFIGRPNLFLNGDLSGNPDQEIRPAFQSTAQAVTMVGTNVTVLNFVGAPYDYSAAYGINSSGVVVGEVFQFRSPGNSGAGIVWFDQSHYSIIFPFSNGLEGLPYCRASSINDAGQIVGTAGAGFNVRHAFIAYANAQLAGNPIAPVDLNTLIDTNSGWVLNLAEAINAKGQIVGVGTYQGQQHGYLLTPAGSNLSPTLLQIRELAGITVSGVPGQKYEIQYKSNAADTTWVALAEITLATATQEWADPDSYNHPGRLYRFLSKP